MTRLTVYLTDQEREALHAQAERDMRGLRDQARYLIIRGLAAEPVAKVDLQSAIQPAKQGGCTAEQAEAQ